ncbi:hypothetical protein GF318_03695 [Candidatus Micrarchaeota archaeon]|nr:hypothetical protein [Candidatus Micrarchaeota archaeon]
MAGPVEPVKETKEEKGQPREEKFQDKLERGCTRFVDAIGYDRLKLWKEVMFHPSNTFSQELGKQGFMRGAKDIFISNLIPLAIGFIFLMLFAVYGALLGLMATLAAPGIGILALAAMVVAGLVLVVLYFASPIISWLIQSAVQYLIAKLLGGTGSFRNQSYLIALGSASAAIVFSILYVFSFVPCLGYAANAVMILVGIYAIYLNYRAVKIAHGLSTIKAAVVTLAPVAIFFAMVIAAIIAFYLGIFSLAFLGSSAG